MRQSLVRLLLSLSALTLAVAVSSEPVQAQGEAQEAKPTKARKPRGDRNRLTKVEIDEAGDGVVTARDAIRILRPQWLNPPMGRVASTDMARDTRAASTVVVYIDDIRQPDVESSLITVPKGKLVEIRYLDQNRAVQMRGPGHEAGVIEVTTTDKRK